MMEPEPCASEGQTLRWSLVLPDGSSLLVPEGGLTIGRDPSCDLVASSAHVSRRQARVDLTPAGPRITNLGRAILHVDGQPLTASVTLENGQCVALPELRIHVGARPAQQAGGGPRWLLESCNGSLIGIGRSPFVVGGGPNVDLALPECPSVAVELIGLPRVLAAEFHAAGLLDGRPVAAGELRNLRPGSTIAWGNTALRVVAGGEYASLESTQLDDDEALPSRVELCFLPRGGRLVLVVAGRRRELNLSGKRCDLAAALLQPPNPLVAGEFVSDEVLLRRVWPAQPNMGRTNLNMLIHRLRRDLIREGVDGCRLIERAPLGGATRFRMRPDASVALS